MNIMTNQNNTLAAAEAFYATWIEKEEANLDSAKRALISYTEMLNKSIADENWQQVTEMGSKVATESFAISRAASQIAYYQQQLGYVEDAMFDEGHPGHESK